MKMTIDTTIVTIHGASRAKERCNVKNVRSAEKNVTLAIQRGKRAADCTSWERAYLESEAYDDCIAVAYNNFCYIFNPSGVCVTIYQLPAWFGKKKHFNGKERIRNYKKYCRSNRSFRESCAVC
jgi:hypothetical protein